VQTPVDRRLIQASERLAALRGISEPSPRLVPGLAVVTAGVILFGVHSVVAPKALSDAVLQPAVTLPAAGALTVVFARTPLRLAAGALAILTAFELAYARLDPGLVVTGGLAVFQLLFAIVASYFVGGGDAQP
jgi:hypothetical protein